MLCSKELIRDYLLLSNTCHSNNNITPPESDLITRIITGEDVVGINYVRRCVKSHKYVSFGYIYAQRSYVIEISCNNIHGYFTTLNNNVCTKQAVYESIFAHDRSYVSLFTREYIALKLSENAAIEAPLGESNDDIFKFVNIIKMINLKVRFGKFDFSQLWDMEKSQCENDDQQWYDHEIDVNNESNIGKLNQAGEIHQKIRTCRYPLVVNGCKIVNKLNYPHDEVQWALKSIYSGTITTTVLSQSRVELLREMGVDIDGMVASCVCFISNESQLYAVEFD